MPSARCCAGARCWAVLGGGGSCGRRARVGRKSKGEGEERGRWDAFGGRFLSLVCLSSACPMSMGPRRRARERCTLRGRRRRAVCGRVQGFRRPGAGRGGRKRERASRDAQAACVRAPRRCCGWYLSRKGRGLCKTGDDVSGQWEMNGRMRRQGEGATRRLGACSVCARARVVLVATPTAATTQAPSCPAGGTFKKALSL